MLADEMPNAHASCGRTASSSGGSRPTVSTAAAVGFAPSCWKARDAPAALGARRVRARRARPRGRMVRVPLYRDEAIVLRTHKLGEADRIITLLTRQHGRVRAVAKGVRRTTSRFGLPARAVHPRRPAARRGPHAST